MQIIEHSFLGVRSAVLRLTRRAGGPAVTMFPMLHVAEPAFYREVERRLRTCDLLVVEGIHGSSTVTDALTMTYRAIPANADGLIEDDISYQDLGVPLITPDLSGAELEQGWRELRWPIRLAAMAAVPVVSLSNFLSGRRGMLSRDLEVSDLPTAAEELRGDELDRFWELLVDGRDNRLLAAVAEILRERSDEEIDIAVVYGAAHVPGILRGLYPLGYRVVAADWVMAVSEE